VPISVDIHLMMQIPYLKYVHGMALLGDSIDNVMFVLIFMDLSPKILNLPQFFSQSKRALCHDCGNRKINANAA
jgi:hypothetical protein